MKVLQINSVCGVGSTGRIATDIHNTLLAEGHESYIAYGRDEPKYIDVKYTLKIGDRLDSYYHVARTRVFDEHGLGAISATVKFIDAIIKLNPDVIHLHNIHGYYLNYPLLFEFFKKVQIKIIWTLHDCWPFTGHCAYYDYVKCEKWKTECQQCPQKNEYPKSFFFDNSKQNYKLKKEMFLGINDLTIVTPSEWLKDEVKKSFLKGYKLKVVHNGVDINVFSPTCSDFRKSNGLVNKFIILGVASPWSRRKGYKYFFELASELNDDEVIIMVGLNKAQIKQLPSNIIGIERTGSVTELAEIYSSVDVFLNPTLEDNFPTTNLESLACGVPVITFKTGGSPEAIDKTTGLIAPTKSTEALMFCINEVKSKGKKYYNLACEDRASQLFDKNKQFKKYISIYSESLV